MSAAHCCASDLHRSSFDGPCGLTDCFGEDEFDYLVVFVPIGGACEVFWTVIAISRNTTFDLVECLCYFLHVVTHRELRRACFRDCFEYFEI